MLTLFLGLVDRLIKIVELRQSDRKQLFKDVVEPLFNQLQPVVDDYFSLFRRAKMLAARSKTSDDLRQSVEEVRTQREKMVQARLAVVKFAEALQSQVHEKRVAEFAHKVELFFLSTTVHRVRRMSEPAKLVELFDYVAGDRLEKETLVAYIDETLRYLESTWIAIAQSYAALRIYCMSPDRYIERQLPDDREH